MATPSAPPTEAPQDAAERPTKGTYSFVSLGCPKNLVDSERMLGLLQLDGYQLVSEPAGADFVVVNTCGFIERARDESFAAIHEMLELKRKGEIRGVIVSGCLAEREKETLLETLPEIDHLVGVFGREEVTKVADRLIGGLDEQRTVFQPAPSRPLDDRSRLRITPRHFAFLKISEGCDRLCTFCAIPKMRGKHATKPIEEVVAEARELAADGVRELVIVAQDTTYYGMDLYGEPRLAELLGELEQVEGIEWIRLMYLYPMYFGDELIDADRRQQEDRPLSRLAAAAHQRHDAASGCSAAWTGAEPRNCWPSCASGSTDLVMRTTFITGFPGETDEQFEELVEFVAGSSGSSGWACSPIRSSPTRRRPGCRTTCPRRSRRPRRERLMAVQQEIAFDWNAAQIGRQLRRADRPGRAGRERRLDRPQLCRRPGRRRRGLCFRQEAAAGQIVRCEIVATSEYDLVGVAVGKPR